MEGPPDALPPPVVTATVSSSVDSESSWRRALPIYYALLLAIATVALLYLAIRLKDVLVILFISLLFAATVARPASYLERFRVPRAIAALVVYAVVVAVIAALLLIGVAEGFASKKDQG